MGRKVVYGGDVSNYRDPSSGNVPGSPAFLPSSSEGESAESDGVCLRCQRCRTSDGTTAGVGEDF